MTKDEAGAAARRVWVICEGKHEQDGSLETLIRRLRDDANEWEIEYEPWKNRRGGRRRFRSTGKGDRVFKKLIAALMEAVDHGFDAVICVIDQDRDPQRLQSVTDAQESDHSPLPRAFGVAIESYDAWFLADEIALTAVAGKPIQRQPEPEKTREPKAAIKSLCGDAKGDQGLAAFYTELAMHVDLEALRQRCPNGFAPWAERVTSLQFPPSNERWMTT